MAEKNHTGSGFWDLLNLMEDFLKSGFKSRHEPTLLADDAFLFESGTDAAPIPPEMQKGLSELAAEIGKCTKCDLHFNRLQPVPGEGVCPARVMVIGEAPGEEEDKKGRPFVGRAGQYLDKWLQAINLDRRTNCYIGNIVKCRPPENRDPHPEEIEACLPYLEEQLKLIAPKFLLTVGRISSQTLTGSKKGIGSLRGGTYFYKHFPLVPTFHPSAVLRDQSLRAAVWEDLKLLKALFKQ